MQYIALIHKNSDSTPTPDDWVRFVDAAKATGMFKGGSAVSYYTSPSPRDRTRSRMPSSA